MPCRQCEHPLEKGIHTCERGPFNTERDALRARVTELEEAAKWILKDAYYKAPEQIHDIEQRWIDRLESVINDR